METVVDQLLEIDRKARQSIDEARQYYENTMQEIEARRRAIIREYNQKADDRIESVRRTEEEAQREYLAAIKREYDVLAETLDAAFARKHEEWEREIFRRIVAGAEEAG